MSYALIQIPYLAGVIYYLYRCFILCGNSNVKGSCHYFLPTIEDWTVICFGCPCAFGFMLNHMGGSIGLHRLFHLPSWWLVFLNWHCLHVVTLYCPNSTPFCKHSTRILQLIGLEYIIFTFASLFFLDPMKIAVLWQMAVIPFGHEMTPLTFSSKVKVKEVWYWRLTKLLMIWCWLVSSFY